jgi:hypothetical protein
MSKDCDKPVVTEIITKKREHYTVMDVMRSIRKGFDGIIQPGKRIDFGEKVKKYPNEHFESNFDKNEYIYGKIADWIDSSNRLNLVSLYEGGDLKPVDLAGDHIYFEGVKRKKNTKYLVISFGS